MAVLANDDSTRFPTFWTTGTLTDGPSDGPSSVFS